MKARAALEILFRETNVGAGIVLAKAIWCCKGSPEAHFAVTFTADGGEPPATRSAEWFRANVLDRAPTGPLSALRPATVGSAAVPRVLRGEQQPGGALFAEATSAAPGSEVEETLDTALRQDMMEYDAADKDHDHKLYFG